MAFLLVGLLFLAAYVCGTAAGHYASKGDWGIATLWIAVVFIIGLLVVGAV